MAKERILIIDDEPSISGLLSEFLAQQDYEPLTAPSPREALARKVREALAGGAERSVDFA